MIGADRYLVHAEFLGGIAKGKAHELGKIEDGDIELRSHHAVDLSLTEVEVLLAQRACDGDAVCAGINCHLKYLIGKLVDHFPLGNAERGTAALRLECKVRQPRHLRPSGHCPWKQGSRDRRN